LFYLLCVSSNLASGDGLEDILAQALDCLDAIYEVEEAKLQGP
jgi:hypothetical protein